MNYASVSDVKLYRNLNTFATPQTKLKLEFVTAQNNRTRKPYVCKAEPFNDMGHLNCSLEWENGKKPSNYKQYEDIINKELWGDKMMSRIESYLVQKPDWEYSAKFFKTKSKKKQDNVFRYYLPDVFVRIDLNNFNY